MIKNSEKGFTLVELIVVAGIMILFSSIILVDYREGGRNLTLQRAANKLAQDIRRVEEMAMSAKECSTICGYIPPKVPAGGYGVRFDNSPATTFFIYADDNGNQQYDGAGDPIVEQIGLEEGVQLFITFPGASYANINFLPPDPKVSIKVPSGDINELTIYLCFEENNNCSAQPRKSVKINITGLIYVE